MAREVPRIWCIILKSPEPLVFRNIGYICRNLSEKTLEQDFKAKLCQFPLKFDKNVFFSANWTTFSAYFFTFLFQSIKTTLCIMYKTCIETRKHEKTIFQISHLVTSVQWCLTLCKQSCSSSLRSALREREREKKLGLLENYFWGLFFSRSAFASAPQDALNCSVDWTEMANTWWLFALLLLNFAPRASTIIATFRLRPSFCPSLQRPQISNLKLVNSDWHMAHGQLWNPSQKEIVYLWTLWGRFDSLIMDRL